MTAHLFSVCPTGLESAGCLDGCDCVGSVLSCTKGFPLCIGTIIIDSRICGPLVTSIGSTVSDCVDPCLQWVTVWTLFWGEWLCGPQPAFSDCVDLRLGRVLWLIRCLQPSDVSSSKIFYIQYDYLCIKTSWAKLCWHSNAQNIICNTSAIINVHPYCGVFCGNSPKVFFPFIRRTLILLTQPFTTTSMIIIIDLILILFYWRISLPGFLDGWWWWNLCQLWSRSAAYRLRYHYQSPENK